MDKNNYGSICVKKDCKMYDEAIGCCKGLKDLYCKREKCNFYKPSDKKSKNMFDYEFY